MFFLVVGVSNRSSSGLFRGGGVCLFFLNAHSKAAMSGRTILVGGGTGLIGQYLCPALSKKGYDVIIISRKARPGIPKTLTWAQVGATSL